MKLINTGILFTPLNWLIVPLVVLLWGYAITHTYNSYMAGQGQ